MMFQVHFVHYKEEYVNSAHDTLDSTLTDGKNDVAAVIGVFFEVI